MTRRLAAFLPYVPGLLALTGLAGVFVGLWLSPWPWLAPLVVGGTVFGCVALTHLRGGYEGDT